jgi:hypothetical protein
VTVAARLVLATLAALALAWLVVMQRDVRLQERGIAGLKHLQAPGAAAAVEADLRGARLLNPDTTPDLYRVLLYRAQGRPGRAIATAEAVVRGEPDNATAWRALLLVARGHDRVAARRAAAEVRRLDPINSRSR